MRSYDMMGMCGDGDFSGGLLLGIVLRAVTAKGECVAATISQGIAS